MPELIARVQRAAPRVRIAVRASDALRGTGMLENDEMDLGVSGATMAGEGRAQPTEMRPRSGGAADGTAEERLIFRRGAIRRNPRL
jgi:hypothetical protein